VAMSQATMALLICIAFYAAHRRVQPFNYAFQNRLDGLLFLADIAVIFLGALYTAIHNTVAAVPIEVFVVFFFVGSFVGAIGYVATREAMRRRRKRRAAAEPAAAAVEDVTVDAADEEDEDGDDCGDVLARENLRSNVGTAQLLETANGKHGSGETIALVEDDYGMLSSRVSVRARAQSRASNRGRGSHGINSRCQRSSEVQMVEVGTAEKDSAAACVDSASKATCGKNRTSVRQGMHSSKLQHRAL
jgi:hypothetical protein